MSELGYATRRLSPRTKASLGVVAVLLEMLCNEGVENAANFTRQNPLPLQHVAKRLVFFEHPGVHRGDKLVARDEIHLVRKDSK